MEKRTPHYDLHAVQNEVARLGAKAFTKSALDGGRALGLTTGRMLQVVASLERAFFYKSMESQAVPGTWQDVYRPWLPGAIQLYVKVTYRDEGGPPVISFKEK